MSQSQERVTREDLYTCPCCNKQFFAKVTYALDEIRALYAFRLALCDDCKNPCCPRCEYVGGERVICTRCTTYPSCTHAHTSPEQELYQRLVLLRGRVRRIEIGWNASDGGPWGAVKLLDEAGGTLDTWNDWAILSSVGRSGVEIMEEIIVAALGERAIRERDIGTYFANFEIG